MAYRNAEQPVNYVDNVFPYANPCSGNVTFTGPEGLRDYRPHRVDDHHAIGVGDVSSERSLDSGYLLRPAPGATLERPRSCHPGEVGWGIPWLVDWAPPKTGQQIMIGDFRQIAEDRATSQYLGAWYPGPKESTPQGSDGYYRENVYSGMPNVRLVTPQSPWRPAGSSHNRHAHNSSQRRGNVHAVSSTDTESSDRE